MAPFQAKLRVSVLAFVTPAFAITTFQPNCTIPDTRVNIVSSTGVRSTYDILWSSLFTLLVCTWTIQHLNIPRQTPDCTTWRQSLKESIKRVWAKLKWMLLTLIMPEFLVGKALQDFIRARKFCREMKEFAIEDGVSWTMTHCFYADMGGFLYEKVYTNDYKESSTLAQSTAPPQVVDTHHEPADGTEKVYICKNAKEIAVLRRNGTFQRLPDITEKAIWDKSKGDAFVKGIAIVQVIWLIVQVISRAAKGLPISQLEIAVLAYSACATLTYGLWWYKPQNIGIPTYIDESVSTALDTGSGASSWFRYFILAWTEDLALPDSTIPNDACYLHGPKKDTDKISSYMNIGLFIGGTVFGALHCVAWDFQFPSRYDALLWKVSAIICTACLPAYYAAYESGDLFLDKRIGMRGYLLLLMDLVILILVCCLVIAYIFARLCLIVLVFRSLFYLQPEAFLSTWSSQVPHV